MEKQKILTAIFTTCVGTVIAALIYDYMKANPIPEPELKPEHDLVDDQPKSAPDEFKMEGNTSKAITSDEIILSMIGTPCGANRTVVCIKVDGVKHSLRLGDEVNVPYSNGQCTLALVRILEGKNAAMFNLRC